MNEPNGPRSGNDVREDVECICGYGEPGLSPCGVPCPVHPPKERLAQAKRAPKPADDLKRIAEAKK